MTPGHVPRNCQEDLRLGVIVSVALLIRMVLHWQTSQARLFTTCPPHLDAKLYLYHSCVDLSSSCINWVTPKYVVAPMTLHMKFLTLGNPPVRESLLHIQASTKRRLYLGGLRNAGLEVTHIATTQ